MMVTAFLSVVAVSEPDPVEYVDIECQPAAISVDCNNVQLTPLKLKALHRSGADAALLDVFWRLYVQSAGKDLGTADSPGASSEWEYYLPSDKWGNADSVIVEAYRDSARETLLAQKRASIVRQNPSPFPVDGDWKPLPFKYKNGEYFLDKEKGFVFMWMNPVAGNSEMHPFDDVAQNPDTTSWKSIQEYPLLGTQLLLARKIDADLIDVDNLKVKHLEGADGDFTGKINAKEGSVGDFDISSDLHARRGNDDMLLSASLIRFRNQYVSTFIGADTIPASSGGVLISPIRIEVSRSTASYSAGINTCLHSTVYGAKSYDDFVETGNHVLFAPKGDICGFRLRTRRVDSNITLSLMDSIIMAVSKGITMNLPSNAEDGQIYFIRNHSNGDVYVYGRISPLGYPTSGTTKVHITGGWLAIFIYDKFNNIWTGNRFSSGW